MKYLLSLVLILSLAAFSSHPVQAAALSDTFGIIGAVPSLGGDAAKQQATDMIVNLGMGWTRQEFTYQNPMDFSAYDAASVKLKSRSIQTLGLLVYPGVDRTHDDWKSYVQSVVGHFSDIPAWEIMNEADNYLSGADYTVYLREARDIIKTLNPSATIVLSGITSRVETPNFWHGVAAAGGWTLFDIAGLHVYHAGNPEKVNFGGGDLLAEYDRAIGALRKNGGGKKIWITEMGYEASDMGNENQANWLVRALVMTRSVSIVEKIFIYRLYDDSRATYGLAGADLTTRPAFDRIKELISQIGTRGVATRLYPTNTVVLDAYDRVNGWKTDATTNGSLVLSGVDGHNGQAMKLNYDFSNDKAYAVAQKSIPIIGQPQALAAWIYGDDSGNVWKLRFKDARGETFQTDLGTTTAGWSYKQFVIGQDVAYVSWDGDGKVDYPISFDSFVVDRQGGSASASGLVDDLIAINSDADLYSFLFGDLVAYWKATGSTTSVLCGASRHFGEIPAYVNAVSCSDTPKTAVTAAPKAAAATAAPKSAKLVVDKSKSTSRPAVSATLATTPSSDTTPSQSPPVTSSTPSVLPKKATAKNYNRRFGLVAVMAGLALTVLLGYRLKARLAYSHSRKQSE